ncbi:YdgA family protein [Vibrio porteresiae]|uniref:YdgA family protein n=1 Tax=Vibrio porteresiae DSM 19223 TaxID=1123496 RepID=A0ABZ0QEZ4_9VIBR|nr:YdgA family protein [Vibrio porteresiae]WPC75041.1 YdgA family protein [Vibrio porteresiae DSM 19223]
MKRKLVASGIILAAVGCGFVANNIMINKAGQEVTTEILHTLQNYENDSIQIQRLSSEVNGSKIEEQYVIYIIVDGKRADNLPIFFNHTAKIGLFASSINGNFTIVKDKGLAKKFIEEVTTFNDNIAYSFSTIDNNIDLKGEVQVGKIQDGLSYLELGELTFSSVGSSKQFSSTIHLPRLIYNKRDEQYSLSDFTIKSVGGENAPKNTFDIKTGKMSLLDNRYNQSLQVSGFEWNTSLTNEPSATLTADIDIDKLNINIDNVPKDNFDITLNLNVPGIPKSQLKEFSDVLAKGNISNHVVKKQAENILNQLLDNGINGNSFTLKVNDSLAKGSIALAPAKYSEMRPYQKRTQLIENLSAQVDFDLDKSLVQSFPTISPVMHHYFDVSPQDKYTATFKLTNGQPTLNGQPLQ